MFWDFILLYEEHEEYTYGKQKVSIYKKEGNYLGLVPIHVGLKGQLHLAQGNTLGIMIPHHSGDRAVA